MAFDTNFKTEYKGPLLIITSGGLYNDLATGEMTAIKPSQELRSAITDITMLEKTNISAWTTLAVARVLADRGFLDKTVADLKDVDRINMDFSQLSYFLSGKSTNYINVRSQKFFDIEKDPIKFNDAGVILHLTHGGLSHLANNFSTIFPKDGMVVSVADLILALTDDLSDRIFDGRDSHGGIVYLGSNHQIELNSYTVRKQLSEAILLYAKHLQESGKLTADDSRNLMTPGKLVDYLAKDVRRELFPEKDKPMPIDTEAPQLQIGFAGEHESEKPFAVLDGDIFFNVTAKDESRVTEIKMVAPNMAHSKDGFGPIEKNYIQDSTDIAKVCGKKDEFMAELEKRALKKENVICACFEASDVLGNTRQELGCFQRKSPKPVIKSPTNDSVLTSKSFLDGVKVQATITSGLDLLECSWAIYDRQSRQVERKIPLKGNGKLAGNSCTIDETIRGNSLSQGKYYLAVYAKDVAGRKSSDGRDVLGEGFINFRVAK